MSDDTSRFMFFFYTSDMTCEASLFPFSSRQKNLLWLVSLTCDHLLCRSRSSARTKLRPLPCSTWPTYVLVQRVAWRYSTDEGQTTRIFRGAPQQHRRFAHHTVAKARSAINRQCSPPLFE